MKTKALPVERLIALKSQGAASRAVSAEVSVNGHLLVALVEEVLAWRALQDARHKEVDALARKGFASEEAKLAGMAVSRAYKALEEGGLA